MNIPPEHYYEAEFEGAPCPTVQEEMALSRIVEEGERLLRYQAIIRFVPIVVIILGIVLMIASDWI
jgi:hypothetical protein